MGGAHAMCPIRHVSLIALYCYAAVCYSTCGARKYKVIFGVGLEGKLQESWLHKFEAAPKSIL